MTFKALITAGVLLASTAMANAAEHVVTISNFAFEPANLTIAAGDIVTFINTDNAPHTATDDNGAFDTGTLQRNGESVLTFASAGAFAYFCKFHPGMRATITVE